MTDPDPEAGDAPNRPEAATARERVLDDHGDLLAEILASADAVEADLPSPITDGRALSSALERRLAAAGVRDRLPAVLRTAVEATDRTTAAEPVAAPPYVVVTGRGPLLRATLAGGRLLVGIFAFDVERGPVRYVRTGSTPAEAVSVRFER